MSANAPQELATAVSSVAVGLLMALPVRDHLHDRSHTSWGDFDSFGSSAAREFGPQDHDPGLLAA
jgi:hypothetical protein